MPSAFSIAQENELHQHEESWPEEIKLFLHISLNATHSATSGAKMTDVLSVEGMIEGVQEFQQQIRGLV